MGNSYFSHDWINYFLKIFEIYPFLKKKILILSWIMEDGLPTTATIGNNKSNHFEEKGSNLTRHVLPSFLEASENFMTPWDENRIEILHCQNGTNIDFKMNLGSNVLKDWALFMLSAWQEWLITDRLWYLWCRVSNSAGHLCWFGMYSWIHCNSKNAQRSWFQEFLKRHS